MNATLDSTQTRTLHVWAAQLSASVRWPWIVAAAFVAAVLLFVATADGAHAQGGQPIAPATLCTVQSNLPRTECEALVELYIRTDGANWLRRDGWTSNPNPCTWYGVACSAGHVTALELSGNRLRGPLPRKLPALTGLSVLRLDNNSLSGAIPVEFCALAPQLTALALDYNLLFAQGAQVAACVESRAPGWAGTQTTPPLRLQAAALRADAVVLEWQPISYTTDGGYYELSLSASGSITPFVTARTPDKMSASLTITGLQPGRSYQAQVVSFTPAHGNQPDDHRSAPAQIAFSTRADQRVLMLLYFSADNDLDPYIEQILERVRRGTLANRNLQAIYLADGSEDGDTRIWSVAEGVATPTALVAEWWGQTELDTADPDVLARFLTSARAAYGQDVASTIVALIGHGVAPAPELAWVPASQPGEPEPTPQPGIPALPRGLDYTPTDITDASFMSTPALGRALAAATNDGANPFDLVFFDQCFQGNLDVLYEVRNAARVFVASPNYAWLVAPYHLYIPYFAPAQTPEQMADAIIHLYQRTLSDGNPNAIIWMSSADISAVAAAVNELGDALIGAIDAGRSAAILQAAGTARYADTTQCGEGKLHLGPPDELIGAGLLAKNLVVRFSQPDVEDPFVVAAATQLLETLARVKHTFRIGYPYIQPDEFWDYDDKLTLLAPLPRTLPASVVWRASIYRSDTPLQATWTPDPSQEVLVTEPFDFVVDGRWDEFLDAWYDQPLQPTVGEWCTYTPPTVVVSGTVETLALGVSLQTATAVRLEWSQPGGSTPSAYHVLAQKPGGISEVLLAVVGAGQRSFVIDDAAPGDWSFRVVAVDDDETTLALSEQAAFHTLFVPFTTR